MDLRADKVSRRNLLKTSLVAGGGMLTGSPFCSVAEPWGAPSRIHRDRSLP